jgi:hypothetical protein
LRVPLWVAELAHAFWTEAGGLEAFPRSLRGSIARGLPVAVVYLPQLRLMGVRDWLVRNSVVCPCDQADRQLRACLVARSGHGFIFIDGTDPEEEQRFSLAHELAHFLRDYWQPRRLARQRLGEVVLEVFDGKRGPTAQERLQALVAQVPIGFHVHLLSRQGEEPADSTVAKAEEEADQLAYELLAPAAAVRVRAAHAGMDQPALVEVLQKDFGLPPAPAKAYAGLLSPAGPPTDPLLLRLLR